MYRERESRERERENSIIAYYNLLSQLPEGQPVANPADADALSALADKIAEGREVRSVFIISNRKISN